MSDVGKTCGTCKYFNKEPLQPRVGTCHKKCPVAMLMPTQGGLQMVGAFPPIKESDWCGEYEQKVTMQ